MPKSKSGATHGTDDWTRDIVDRRDAIRAARLARAKAFMAAKQAANHNRIKLEKLLKEGFGERQALGNAFATRC